MSSDLCSTGLTLPKSWKQSINSVVIHTLSLAFKSIILTLSQLSENDHLPIRIAAELKRLKMENAQVVRAKYPNHLWHVDLSVTPTAIGFWVPWTPRSLFQIWPFCWWFALVMDHYSRRCMGFALFKKQPTSLQVRQFMGRVIQPAGRGSKHLVCDQGPQFTDNDFKEWCKRKLGRKPRYGAVGKHGSIAVIERFIRTFKDIYLRKITIPYASDHMRSEMTVFIQWYNAFRPHESLEGATPLELYENHSPASKMPRYEPRKRWPRKASCAHPVVPVKGECGSKLELIISFMDDHGKLPVIELRQAA